MTHEIPDNVNISLEELVDQILGSLETILDRKMTQPEDREYVRKWRAEYNYPLEIIYFAHVQARLFRSSSNDMEDIDDFLIFWHEEKLKDPAEIRVFEKSLGR